MPTNVAVSVYYLAVVSKPLDLAALFTPATRTVGQINGVKDLTMVILTALVLTNSQKDEGSIRGVPIRDPKLFGKEIGHIYTVCAVVPRLMIAADNGNNLMRYGAYQINHCR